MFPCHLRASHIPWHLGGHFRASSMCTRGSCYSCHRLLPIQSTYLVYATYVNTCGLPSNWTLFKCLTSFSLNTCEHLTSLSLNTCLQHHLKTWVHCTWPLLNSEALYSTAHACTVPHYTHTVSCLYGYDSGWSICSSPSLFKSNNLTAIQPHTVPTAQVQVTTCYSMSIGVPEPHICDAIPVLYTFCAVGIFCTQSSLRCSQR